MGRLGDGHNNQTPLLLQQHGWGWHDRESYQILQCQNVFFACSLWTAGMWCTEDDSIHISISASKQSITHTLKHIGDTIGCNPHLFMMQCDSFMIWQQFDFTQCDLVWYDLWCHQKNNSTQYKEFTRTYLASEQHNYFVFNISPAKDFIVFYKANQ